MDWSNLSLVEINLDTTVIDQIDRTSTTNVVKEIQAVVQADELDMVEFTLRLL